MFHTNNDTVRSLLIKGNFGLEKESLRITGDGSFALSLHPFPDNKNIVYDFCENQTEINTDVAPSASEGVSHIELRTVDLNPYELSGINLKDLKFIQLLFAWMIKEQFEDDFAGKGLKLAKELQERILTNV